MLGFFHRLKVSQKLALISVFFLIPDSVLTCLFLFSINSNIRFAAQEKHGNEYQRPLEVLLEAIPAHHLAGQAPRTTADPTNGPGAVETQIEAAFGQLSAVNDRLGEKLQFTPEGLAKRQREQCRVEVIRAKWTQLKEQAATLSPEEFEGRHRQLVTDLRMMITHVGDNSNLILDPDLDSYYLMDVTLLALPQMQDRLWTVMAYAASALRKETLTTEEKRQLAVHAALLREADFDRVLGSAQTAFNEDPNFYGVSGSLESRVRPALETFRTASDDFIGRIARLAETGGAATGVHELLAAGERARAASFVLWRVADEELDVLLDRRIEHFRSRRARSLVLTGLALLAAVSFVSFITHSISGPLQRQAHQLSESNEALRGEIAERQRMADALRVAEERYRTIFENAGEGIYQTSPAGVYLVANPPLARMYGYDSVEELQASLTDLEHRLYVDPTRRTEFQRQIERTGRISEFESQVFRKDGSVIWISERARLVRDAAGHALYYEGTVEDITERKAREAEVDRLHRELVDASRLAGMAEIATGVLHNVGNVLNSVNVSATEVRDRLTHSRIGHLRKTTDLLGQHRAALGSFLTEDSKGRAIPGFLDRLTTHLEDENRTLVAEMDSVARHVEHLKQIVTSQQDHARRVGVLEPLQPAALVEEALQLVGDSLTRHGIMVEQFVGSPMTVTADRHKVLQIMVNLLRNAKQAVAQQNPAERRIRLTVAAAGSDRVSITVQDNGAGISPEHLAQLFQHGFTTKPNGHGFGLHSSILAAREMNGDLRAASTGVGLGAAFTLELPVCLPA